MKYVSMKILGVKEYIWSQKAIHKVSEGYREGVANGRASGPIQHAMVLLKRA